MPDKKSSLKKSELERSHLFEGVQFGSVIGLLEDCPIRELKQEDVLLNRGEGNHLLYLILSGRLRVHLELSVDPLTVLGPGEVVGELSLIDGQPTSAYVVADDDCRVLALNEKTLWSLVEASHIVARNLLFVLSRRLRHGDSIILTSQQLQREYAHYAVIDALTGLYNRRWLDTMLGRQMERSKKGPLPLCLLLMDVDHFKQYNRTHGDQAGDRVLHTLASTLRESMRPGEMLARYGEGEFIALLPELEIATAHNLGERVRQAVAHMGIFSLDQHALPAVTISIGVAQMAEEDTPQTLIDAVYLALSEGRAAQGR